MRRVCRATSVPMQCLCVAVLGLLLTGEARATHKSWLLKNSGAQCVLQHPARDDAYPGIVENGERAEVFVSCSVTLAARGGSSAGPRVLTRTWLAAKQARVFIKQVRSRFWCQARAEDFFGNVYWGAKRWSSGNGVQVIDLIEDERDWGGTLGLGPNYIRQLDFECRIGGGRASNPAQLFGYDVAICQNSSRAWCTTVRVDGPGRQSWVQGNGIECAASTADGGRFLRRSVYGIKNEGTDRHSVHCPITQPADDSYEHDRQIYTLEVAYAGPRPSCRIESFDQRGVLHSSPPLEPGDILRPSTLELPAVFTSGIEKSLAVRCDLPPNSTIEGYLARMSVTRKSGGL